MNKRLDEAFTKVKALADEHQQEVAELLFEYIEAREAGTWLTPEQIAEIERRLADDEPDASIVLGRSLARQQRPADLAQEYPPVGATWSGGRRR